MQHKLKTISYQMPVKAMSYQIPVVGVPLVKRRIIMAMMTTCRFNSWVTGFNGRLGFRLTRFGCETGKRRLATITTRLSFRPLLILATLTRPLAIIHIPQLSMDSLAFHVPTSGAATLIITSPNYIESVSSSIYLRECHFSFSAVRGLNCDLTLKGKFITE